MSRSAVEREVDEVRRKLLEAVVRDEPLVVVQAPPGSGKTYLIREAAALLRHDGRRVAIAAQTNTQADDICRHLVAEYPALRVVRFHGATVDPIDLGPRVEWTADKDRLPHGPCVVVSTTAKWGLVDIADPFDYLLVDEAWQMAWVDFMLCHQVAARFVLVGDPGQIDPVVTIDVARWTTSPNPPHAPAPALLLSADGLDRLELRLPASRRLPADSIELVNGFYDFPFGSWAQPGDRAFRPCAAHGQPEDPAIDRLADGSVAALTLPTPAEGPPLEDDREIAALAASVATRALERKATTFIDGQRTTLQPSDIGIAATHRTMNASIREALPAALRADVMVDTPERWQGLECKLMIVVHPLSGTLRPSSFDLETGRLCVMASRHKVGVVIVTRDHLETTLDQLAPVADQGLGLPDTVGRGHDAHLRFWRALHGRGRVVPAA